MDDFKWYNDDFQNNSTNTSGNNTYNSQYTQDFTQSAQTKEKRKSKFFKNKKKVATAILSVALVGVITVSGYSLLNNGGSVELSDSLQGNLQSDTSQSDGSTGDVQKLVTGNESKVYTTPEIVDLVGPAVVGVINKATYTNPYAGMFGQQMPSGEVEQGSGSGVIISDDGYIVTNNHVIEGASEILVILNVGEQYTAKLVGSDSKTDLAVLKIEAESRTYSKMGTSSELRVVDTAIAIGNPLGQEFAGTTTQGIISGLNRSVTIDNKTMNLIQTDAAINPGNSGGALVNNHGEVIGINTAKISSSQYEGLGFAIPIDDAKPIIEDLISNGYVTGRPVIGIAGRAVTEQDAQAYNLKVGVYVSSMTADSPAYMAGIKIGDIITECEGTKVETVDELNEIKNKHKVGDTLTMKVFRQGKTIDIRLVLGEEAPGAN
ncbi:MAG: trypsin-like peptidase domain-containing protein [Clostridia bacterium]|nr:trypsin-like peptidase domain-containing protein [Clostridia bacterium]